MGSRKKRPIAAKQLSLPFSYSSVNMSDQNLCDNVISFEKRVDIKAESERKKRDANITKRIVDYADSLDW
jgi:uncharacterized protein with PhoU and TrkA domain